MIYSLKDCQTGGKAIYDTTVEIKEDEKKLYFRFKAEHTSFYCPYHKYNELHSQGDACEVLIGTDSERRFYYEIEISPENELMCALMEYKGEDEKGEPVLGLDFVKECFVESEVQRYENGYEATLSFPKDRIKTGNGEIFFNAYRLETDGGTMDKHLFALNPTMKRKFHRPQYFLYLKDVLK